MNHHITDIAWYENVADFWLSKDQRTIKKAKASLETEINNYTARLDDIFNAQLHTPDTVEGTNANDYLLLKSTFDAFLGFMESTYSWMIQEFEDLHSDLVATASPETANVAISNILDYKEGQARNDIAFETFASELFQMQNDGAYRSHLLDQEPEH